MKQFSYLFLFAVLASFSNKKSVKNKFRSDPIEVLKQLSSKLNAVKDISYSYYRSINYFSEDYHAETKGTTYLDFDGADTLLGFRFQLEDEGSKIIYNGTESFSLDKKNKTIRVAHTPKRNSFESISLFLNSIITLKNSLPFIISDNEMEKTLSDTVIAAKSYYLISALLENKTLSGLGSFSPITIKRNFLYKIVIDKKSYLPLQVIQTNNVHPKDYMLTSFTDIKLKNSDPSEFSWYYSTYNDYTLTTGKKLSLINENSMAPTWELSYFDNDERLHSGQLQNKYVLIEFWTKNCGYCIQAVPKLNGIIEKYKNKNLAVIGINVYDSKQDIKKFYSKNKPLFKTVFDDKGKVTTEFGVEDFPKIVLLDKEGKVVFAGNIDIVRLEKILDAAL